MPLFYFCRGQISTIQARVSKLKAALVTTSCSANSSHRDDCESASVYTDEPLRNDENTNDLPQRSHAEDHTRSSDDDDDDGWEVLETN